MTATAIACNGPAYRRCHNVVDSEHAFVPVAKRIGGKGPMTVSRLIAAAVCDDCYRHLDGKGAKLYPLADALALVAERERAAKSTISLGELLVTSSLFQSSRRAAAARAQQEETDRRSARNEQDARLVAAAQRPSLVA
jgi:hypothetical protein